MGIYLMHKDENIKKMYLDKSNVSFVINLRKKSAFIYYDEP